MKISKTFLFLLCFSISNIFGFVSKLDKKTVNAIIDDLVEFHERTNPWENENPYPCLPNFPQGKKLVARFDCAHQSNEDYYFFDITTDSEFISKDDLTNLVIKARQNGIDYISWFYIAQ